MNDEDYKKVVSLTESFNCCVDSYRVYLPQWKRMAEKACKIIRGYGKIYGAENVMAVIDNLKTNHKRQRAFIDELTDIQEFFGL